MLNASDKKLPDVKQEDPTNDPSGSVLNRRNSSRSTSPTKFSHSETTEDDKKFLEDWPQPPTSNYSRTTNYPHSDPVISDRNNLDHNENLIATSEDDTASVAFSEDSFLEQLEDSLYTPSPDSEVKRSGSGVEGLREAEMADGRRSSSTDLAHSQDLGNRGGRRSSGTSRIPIMQGSSLVKDLVTELDYVESLKSTRNFSVSREENIEMDVLNRDDFDDARSLTTSKESKPRTNDSKMNTTTFSENIPGGSSVSPLIPESFLNASQAISPDVPPPLPTTPVPSDDDLGDSIGSNRPPRAQSLRGMTMREQFEKVVKKDVLKGRFSYPLRPRSPLVLRR